MGQSTDLSEQTQTRLQQPLATQTLLLQVIQHLTSSFDLAEALPHIVQAAVEGTGVDAARIALGGLSFGSGDSAEALTDLDPHALHLSLETGQQVVADLSAVGDDPRYAPLAARLGSAGWWPLEIADQYQGVLWLAAHQPRPFSEEEQVFLATLAGQAALAAASASAHQEAVDDRERLQAILASTTDPVFVVDRTQRVSQLNSPAEQLLSVEAQAVAKQPISDVLRDHPNLLAFFQNNTPLIGDEEWESQDGRTFSPQLTKVPSRFGEFGGWVLILRDVTRFKMLNRNQEEFVRLVSHDLRSPLTYMQGFASLLTMSGELDERQTGFVEKILNGIAQMSALVENIQDAGRWDLQTGFYEMSREPTDLTAMVRDIVSNHQGLADKQNIKLSTSIAPNIPIVSIDALMVERALINLVSNAIKYSPNGGEVNVSTQLVDDSVQICVSDTGLGISPEHLPLLFQRGNRIVTPEIKKNKIKGSGLGLFIVRSVAIWHGGNAWAESTLGKGSQFYFNIPLSDNNLLGRSSS